MNRRGVRVALLLVPVAILGGWLVWLWGSGDLQYRPLVAEEGRVSGPLGHAWTGALHVHSELSGDASGSLEEIVAAAQAADLDFVVISEHTRAEGSRGRPRGGWYGDVLVVVGEEISTLAGHLIALDVPAHPYALGPTAGQAFRDLAELGARALIAHPDGGEESWTGGWSPADGAEVVSLYSALMRASEAGLLRAALAYPLNPMAATARLLRAPSAAIDQWNERTRLRDNRLPRRLAAVGGVDAHGPGAFGFPGYRAAFESLQMTVWLTEPPSPGAAGDRVIASRLAEALAEGRSAIVLAAQGARPAFSWVARNGRGGQAAPGEVARYDRGPWTLWARLPAPGPWEARLLRDGEIVATGRESELLHVAEEPGTYRVEVVRTDLGSPPPGAPPWILSNPIYVWPWQTAVASRLRPTPRLPAPSIREELLTATGWAPQSDEGAYSGMAMSEDGIAWSLRLDAAVEEDRFSALTWRPRGGADWSGRSGLAVRLRSDSTWRIGLRVWTTDDAGDALTWERVVPAGAQPESVATLWRQFRALEHPELTGSLENRLGRVTGAALVVTPQRMRPGAEIRIDVEAFGLFGGS